MAETGLGFSGMIKWDLKTRSCFFYHINEPKNCSGLKAVYTGQGVAKDEAEVETFNKIFLETVLEHGKTRAEQIDEDNLGVHRQLLVDAPRIWGAPVLEKIES
jgi:hypothetical protein